MKLFRLALHHIYSYFINNRLILVFFVLGSLISSIVFIFFYGNFMVSKSTELENSEAYRSYLLTWDKKVSLTKQDLQVLSPWGIEEVGVHTEVELEEPYRALVPEHVKTMVFSFLNNYAYLGEENKKFDDNYLNGNFAIVPRMYGEGLDKFRLNGINFSITGLIDHTASDFFVPIDSYLEHFSVTWLTFLLENIPSDQDMKEIEKVLQQTFPSANLVSPEYNMNLDKNADWYSLLKVSLLYLIALVSFVFIFQYLLEQSSLENVTCYLTGAKRSAVFRVMMMEITILSVVSSVGATVIHKLFYQGLFSKISINEHLEYNLGDYLLVLAVTVLLSLLLSIPFIIQSYRFSLVKMKSKYVQ